MAGKNNKEFDFNDQIVIYYENNKWIAHSIETDQIGVDDDIISAIVDLIKGVRSILELAKEDKTISFKRKAPKEIIKKAEKAVSLPDDFLKLIDDIIYGDWPQKDLQLNLIPKTTNKRFYIKTGIKDSQVAYC